MSNIKEPDGLSTSEFKKTGNEEKVKNIFEDKILLETIIEDLTILKEQIIILQMRQFLLHRQLKNNKKEWSNIAD
jgi:hypothetical protein